MKRILVVDDNRENRYLLESILGGSGYGVVSAKNGAEALQLARELPPDLVVADILMPVMDGYSLCREWKTDGELRGIPFVFYTATYTEPEDEEFALSLGAERFVVKPQEPQELERIVREVLSLADEETVAGKRAPAPPQDSVFLERYSRALFRKLEKKMSDLETLNQSISRETAERKRLEDALHGYEERFHEILDASPIAVAWSDMRGAVLNVNRRFVQLFGYRLDDLPTVDAWFSRAFPDSEERAAMVSSWRHADDLAGKDASAPVPAEARVTCRDGGVRYVSVVNTAITDLRLTMFKDLTEQRSLEVQLIHAQKMESMGQLAGGVAHDFNNILTAIMGYGHLIMAKLPSEEPTRGYVEQILRITDRAANLTRSIFAFSRKQGTELKPVSLNGILHGAGSFLRRLIRENIELQTVLHGQELTILADPCQIEQVLMNLVTNARDAIEGPGTVTIRTGLVIPDDDLMESAGLGRKAPYALLAVEDTGHGMDVATRESIFDPFFTTKEMGKGTGLGLAIVKGIVKHHKGHIHVRSEPGKGTRFCVYFPILDGRDDRVETTPGINLTGGTETILLAEDNDLSRQVTALNLKEVGYEVLEARDGEEAVDLLVRHGERISLLVLDLVMPKKGGLEVFREARAIRPGIRTMFMSGYPDAVIDAEALCDGEPELMRKPLIPDRFIAKIREVLDKKGADGESRFRAGTSCGSAGCAGRFPTGGNPDTPP